MQSEGTIAALATAPAPGGVAIIRLSGERAVELLKKVFHSEEHPEQEPRKLVYGKITEPGSGVLLDQALAVYFKGPHSFTGEDVVELHVHGSPLLAQKILRLLYQHGARPAEPGEFSRRAF